MTPYNYISILSNGKKTNSRFSGKLILPSLLKNSLGFLLIVIFSFQNQSTANAQDVHFSQNYATPQFLNPAMTGLMGGDVRASVVYRNQWSSVMPENPFRTVTASADMSFDGAGEYDRLSLGFLFYNDRAGSVALNTNYLDLSLAYNLAMSEIAYLSVGLQGGITNRSIDFSSAQFGSQADGGIFNDGLSSGETLENQSAFKPNAGAGIMFYIAPNPRSNFYLGGGMYHIMRPDFTVTNEVPDQKTSKISAQLGGSIALGNKLDVVPSFYYIKQGTHTKIDAGSFLRFVFSYDPRNSLERAFNIGGFYRMAGGGEVGLGADAVVLATKLDYDNISFGLSYDLTLSPLADINNGRGGFEIAIIYNTKRKEKRGALNCPKF